MDLRVALWTFGLSIGGMILGDTAGAPYGIGAIVVGAIAGAVMGFALGQVFSRASTRKP